MAVDDLWYLRKRDSITGDRLPSKRHGRGKRWRVRWTDPETGLPVTTLFERKADAERHDANTQADISRGQYIDPRAGKITVGEYADRWRGHQLHRASTIARVESALRLHILPILGRLQMAQVRSSHLKGWVKDRSGHLAASSLAMVYSTVLAPMFTSAVIDKVIGATPCVGIRLPDVPNSEYVIPTADEVHRLHSALPGRYGAVAYLAAGCGLRTGEVFGLEWDDVDFLRREVRVRRQLKAVKGRAPYLGPTKTKTSVRTVELPQVVAEALARHRERFTPKSIMIDDETDPTRTTHRSADLVFLTEHTAPVRPSWWWSVWADVIKEAGVSSNINLRGLRHYFAAVLIFGGANVKTVQLAMGHTTPTITLNTYVGYWPDALDRTRSLVDAALGCTRSVPGDIAT